MDEQRAQHVVDALRKLGVERRQIVASTSAADVTGEYHNEAIASNMPPMVQGEPLSQREGVFDPTRPVTLALRPRLGVTFFMVALAVAFPALMLKLSYDADYFDPREFFLFGYCGLMAVCLVRTRIVIIDGVLWRRSLKRYRGVSLGRLSGVRIIRPRLSKKQGLSPFPLLIVADRSGRVVRLKPVWWARGGRDLLAIVAACVQSQNLAVDTATSTRLAKAGQSATPTLPGWIYGSPLAWEDPMSAMGASTPAAVTSLAVPQRRLVWTRRSPDGRPMKLQPQRLILLLGLCAVTLPVMIAGGRLGTDVVRSLHCSSSQSLWDSLAPTAPGASPSDAASQLASAKRFGSSGEIYNLTSADIANQYNTSAVRQAATSLNSGRDVQWASGNDALADVQLEAFSNSESALRFQRDYAEDHCGGGDLVFSTPGIAGGVGFCQCGVAPDVDRVTFVRGNIRVEAIVWTVPAKQGHTSVLQLASAGLQAEEYRTRT